jgi:leucyl aminopeptidase
MPVGFFDIGDTLATPIFTPDDHLTGFNVFPEARTSLEALKARNVRMGIISNAGDELPERVNALLDQCGLLQFFDPEIIVYGKKDSRAIFVTGAAKAGVTPDQCVFVGENSNERAFALAAGFLRVSPHPSLTLDVIDGVALVYARVKLTTDAQISKWSEIRPPLTVVPLQVTGGRSIVTIATTKAIAALRSELFEVEVPGVEGAPQETDLYLVHDDRETPPGFASAAEHSAGFLAEQGESNLYIADSADGVYLAIPADRSIEEIHFPVARHGHNEKLIPDVTLLNALEEPREADAASFLRAPPEATLSPEEVDAIKAITASTVEQLHQPYAGLARLREHSLPRGTFGTPTTNG